MKTPTGLNRTTLDALRDSFASRVQRGGIPGAVLLLDRGGETWCESVGYRDLVTRDPMTADTIVRIASMTKPITATAILQAVERGEFDLHAPVDRWLPELADRQVLRTPESDLDDTVPANRAISIHDLMTNQWGLGMIFESDPTPLQRAMEAAGVTPGAFPPEASPDAWMAAIGSLPLAFQPGEGWLYHTGFDVLNVLLERRSGRPLGEVFESHILQPLGMVNTAFQVPAASIERLAYCYETDPESGKLVLSDPAEGGVWSRPPAFPSELVSTASDYLVFARMLRWGGVHGETRLLSQESVDLMTSDHVSSRVKQAYPFFPGFWDRAGWGYGVSPITRTGEAPGPEIGAYGWSGGFHTHWMNDPANDLTGLLLMQVHIGGPDDAAGEFWRFAYEALAS